MKGMIHVSNTCDANLTYHSDFIVKHSRLLGVANMTLHVHIWKTLDISGTQGAYMVLCSFHTSIT
jgi:hypothetical protein